MHLTQDRAVLVRALAGVIVVFLGNTLHFLKAFLKASLRSGVLMVPGKLLKIKLLSDKVKLGWGRG